ncbi:Cu(I)-responsive transcriptional regulator [Zophobihabitans entericus]|uniref:Cu(I)-responsive transcriptional regulator n=1 Tax=Zophobihabitans entericus TaxID=1635327 RepID=A0A6G9IFB6_9GAMM|nr:Cu(I)-responsive transcriptional regulator [Zophobihabitans entericus]QIQ22280.1 Cu(I)-responsive transcriptional regulator [Zophobihabitans entericus]
MKKATVQSQIELSEAHAHGFYEIGQASEMSGVSAKMIRHYETIGLIPPIKRTLSNYRIYSEMDVQMLAFIKHTRSLGFSLEQIKELLALWNNEKRTSAEVKQLVMTHIKELEDRIKEMQAMRKVLQNLASSCCGNDDPDCPILDGLSYAALSPLITKQKKV